MSLMSTNKLKKYNPFYQISSTIALYKGYKYNTRRLNMNSDKKIADCCEATCSLKLIIENDRVIEKINKHNHKKLSREEIKLLKCRMKIYNRVSTELNTSIDDIINQEVETLIQLNKNMSRKEVNLHLNRSRIKIYSQLTRSAQLKKLEEKQDNVKLESQSNDDSSSDVILYSSEEERELVLKKETDIDEPKVEKIRVEMYDYKMVKKSIKILSSQFKDVYIKCLEQEVDYDKFNESRLRNINCIFIFKIDARWVTLTNINRHSYKAWLLYDSINDLNCLNNDSFKRILQKLSPNGEQFRIESVNVEKQFGSDSTHLFAIAYATSICFRQSPELIKYTQISMSSQLDEFIKQKNFQEFEGIIFEPNIQYICHEIEF